MYLEAIRPSAIFVTSRRNFVRTTLVTLAMPEKKRWSVVLLVQLYVASLDVTITYYELRVTKIPKSDLDDFDESKLFGCHSRTDLKSSYILLPQSSKMYAAITLSPCTIITKTGMTMLQQCCAASRSKGSIEISVFKPFCSLVIKLLKKMRPVQYLV